MSSWKTEPAPTHRCTVCNGLWRYWPKRDTGSEDAFSLRTACGPCCDTAAMGDQIVPATLEDIERYIAARKAVDAMIQHSEGPKAGDGIN